MSLREQIRTITASERAWAPRVRTARTTWPDLLRVMQRAQEDGGAQAMGELSDYAVNVIREQNTKGYSRAELDQLANEELRRIRSLGLSADEAGLRAYLKVSRAGSHFLLSRTMRAALFVQFVAKGYIK
jgi:hypothetical protein